MEMKRGRRISRNGGPQCFKGRLWCGSLEGPNKCIGLEIGQFLMVDN